MFSQKSQEELDSQLKALLGERRPEDDEKPKKKKEKKPKPAENMVSSTSVLCGMLLRHPHLII